MLTPARIATPPQNLSEYAREIADGLRLLYGEVAAAHYERVAVSGMKATLLTPGITAWSLNTPLGDAAGVIFARVEPARAVIFFNHVLEPYRGSGNETHLLEYALQHLRLLTTEIYTEYISFYEPNLDACYQKHGFRAVKRQIMRRDAALPLRESTIAPGIGTTGPVSSEDAANVLVDAYRQHRERHLFREVHSEALATDYLDRAMSGYFGKFQEGYARAAWNSGRCVGFAVACEVFPDVGFILHLAVAPTHQRCGIGEALLGQLCQYFAEQGLRYIALGVTCDNPATYLYEKAGFQPILHLPVYYRAAG